MTEREREDRRMALGIVSSVGLVMLLVLAMGAFLPSCRGHGPGHRHGFEDVADAREHALHATDWALGRIDADPDQRDRVAAIVGASVEELHELRARHRQNHDRALALLTAAEIDREALEALRADEIELAEEASRRLVTALADVAEVLTPEQRAELREWAEDHHH